MPYDKSKNNLVTVVSSSDGHTVEEFTSLLSKRT